MEKEFLPYELALKLKELGFDEPCFGAYSEDKNNELIYDDENNNYHFRNCSMNDEVNGFLSTPLWQQAFDWFREKGFDNGVSLDEDKSYSFEIWNFKTKRGYYDCGYINYRETRQVCLEKLIELCQKN